MDGSADKKATEEPVKVTENVIAIETKKGSRNDEVSAMTDKCQEGDNASEDPTTTVCLEDGDDILTLEVSALLSPENIDISTLDKVINESGEDLIPDVPSPKPNAPAVKTQSQPRDGAASTKDGDGITGSKADSDISAAKATIPQNDETHEVTESLELTSCEANLDGPELKGSLKDDTDAKDEISSCSSLNQAQPDSTSVSVTTNFKLDNASAASFCSLITTANKLGMDGKNVVVGDASNAISESTSEQAESKGSCSIESVKVTTAEQSSISGKLRPALNVSESPPERGNSEDMNQTCDTETVCKTVTAVHVCEPAEGISDSKNVSNGSCPVIPETDFEVPRTTVGQDKDVSKDSLPVISGGEISHITNSLKNDTSEKNIVPVASEDNISQMSSPTKNDSTGESSPVIVVKTQVCSDQKNDGSGESLPVISGVEASQITNDLNGASVVSLSVQSETDTDRNRSGAGDHGDMSKSTASVPVSRASSSTPASSVSRSQTHSNSASKTADEEDQVALSSENYTSIMAVLDDDGNEKAEGNATNGTKNGAPEEQTKTAEAKEAAKVADNSSSDESSKPDVNIAFPNIAAVVSKDKQNNVGDQVGDLDDFMGIETLETPPDEGDPVIECDIAEGASISTGGDNEGDEEHPLQIEDEDTEDDEPLDTDDKQDEDYVPPGKKQKQSGRKQRHQKSSETAPQEVNDEKKYEDEDDDDDDDCMILIDDSDDEEPEPVSKKSDKNDHESDSQDDVVISKIESRGRKAVQVKTETVVPMAPVAQQPANPNNRMIEIVCLNAATRQPVWSPLSDKQPNLPKFQGKPGMKVSTNNFKPSDFFQLFFGDGLLQSMMQGINEKMRAHFSAHPKSPLKLTAAAELQNFLGILLYFGLDRKPQMDMYWSKDPLLSSSIVRHAMDYGRFTTLLANFNLKHGVEYENPGGPELSQLQYLIDVLRSRFAAVYNPERQLAMTERVIHTPKGGIEYSAEDNCHKRGYHLCHVSDSTGYVYNMFLMDSANSMYSLHQIRKMVLKRRDFIDLSVNGKKVVFLIQRLLDKGYDIQLDERLTSDWLLIYLRQHLTTGFGICSASNAPEPLKSTQEKKIGYRSGQVLALKMFTEKENTYALTTKHSDAFISRMASQAGTVLSRHELVMQSAYKHHEVLRHCCAALQGLNTFTQIFVHLLQIAAFNAHIIATRSGYVLPFIDFYKSIVHWLMGFSQRNQLERPDDSVRLHERHFPTFYSDDKGYPSRQYCQVCKANGITKRTAWVCKQCPSSPYLCLPVCFEIYHTRYKFWGKAARSVESDSGGADVEICEDPESNTEQLSPGGIVGSSRRTSQEPSLRREKRKKNENGPRVRSTSLQPERDIVQILDTPSQPINVISSPTSQQHGVQGRNNEIEIVTDEQTQMNYATLQPVQSVADVLNVSHVQRQNMFTDGIDDGSMLHLVANSDDQLHIMPESQPLHFVQSSANNYQVDGGSDEVQFMDVDDSSMTGGSLVRGSEGGEMEVYIISN